MDLFLVSGTQIIVKTPPRKQMPPYSQNVPASFSGDSTRSANVLATMKPVMNAKQMMNEFAMARTCNKNEMMREVN